MLEKALAELFDFQRFEKNEDLQDVIDSVQAKYESRKLFFLEDEQLDMAAGGLGAAEEPIKDLLKEPKHDGPGLL